MKRILAMLCCIGLLFGLVPAMAEGTDPVTVTIGFSTFYDVDTWLQYSNDVRILREEYGINIEAEQYDDEKIALLLAGDDLPDIMCVWNKYFTTVVDNGIALDLSPYLDNELSNLSLPYYTAAINLSRELLGGEDKNLYFIPNAVGIESANGTATYSRGYVVRWDLYKKLGAPEINSDDDFVDVLEQMVALEPETEEGLPVYAMACTDESLTWWNLRGGFVRETAGTNFWTFAGYQYQASDTDSELYNGYTDLQHSAFWTDMVFFNKLYNRGLFDPDSFIMTRNEYNSKAAAGQYIAIGPSTAGDQYYRELDDTESLKALMTIPSSNAVMYSNRLSLTGNMPSQALIVNAKGKNIDAALKVLNITRDPEFVMMQYNGIQGVDWDYGEDGIPYYTDKWFADNDAYTSKDRVINTGLYGMVSEFTAMSDTMVMPYGGFARLTRNPDVTVLTQSTVLKDFAEYYGYSTPAEVYSTFVEEGKTIDKSHDFAGLVTMAMPAIPDDIKRIMNDANDIIYRAIPELVMAETQADFDALQAQVIEDLASINEQTAWNWIKTEYDAAKQIVQPIFEEGRTLLLGE